MMMSSWTSRICSCRIRALFERAFVLVPLAEIAPERSVGGVKLRDALARLDRSGIEKLPVRERSP